MPNDPPENMPPPAVGRRQRDDALVLGPRKKPLIELNFLPRICTDLYIIDVSLILLYPMVGILAGRYMRYATFMLSSLTASAACVS